MAYSLDERLTQYYQDIDAYDNFGQQEVQPIVDA